MEAIQGTLHQLRHLSEYLQAAPARNRNSDAQTHVPATPQHKHAWLSCKQARHAEDVQIPCLKPTPHSQTPLKRLVNVLWQSCPYLLLPGLRPEDLIKAEGVLLAIHRQRQGSAAGQAAHGTLGVRPHATEHTDLGECVEG